MRVTFERAPPAPPPHTYVCVCGLPARMVEHGKIGACPVGMSAHRILEGPHL